MRRLAEELGAPHAADYPLELLQTLASLKSMLPQRPRVLIDVGAHRGQFSAAAHAVFDFQRIFCYEPNVDLHAELRTAIGTNKLQLFETAVSNRCGQTSFYVHSDSTMSSTVVAAPAVLSDLFPHDDPGAIQARQASTCTLDAALAGMHLTPQDAALLKIDTQGNELQVLQGASEVLQRVASCLVEHIFSSPYEQSYHFEDLIQVCWQNGFRCRGALSLSRRTHHRVTAVDFLFIKDAE
jgi:FkbM family methyltransferase